MKQRKRRNKGNRKSRATERFVYLEYSLAGVIWIVTHTLLRDGYMGHKEFPKPAVIFSLKKVKRGISETHRGSPKTFHLFFSESEYVKCHSHCCHYRRLLSVCIQK